MAGAVIYDEGDLLVYYEGNGIVIRSIADLDDHGRVTLSLGVLQNILDALAFEGHRAK